MKADKASNMGLTIYMKKSINVYNDKLYEHDDCNKRFNATLYPRS